MEQDTNYYCVSKDEVWEYVSKASELLKPDKNGRSMLESSDRHYCMGVLRVLDFVISNGESTMDFDHIKTRQK